MSRQSSSFIQRSLLGIALASVLAAIFGFAVSVSQNHSLCKHITHPMHESLMAVSAIAMNSAHNELLPGDHRACQRQHTVTSDGSTTQDLVAQSHCSQVITHGPHLPMLVMRNVCVDENGTVHIYTPASVPIVWSHRQAPPPFRFETPIVQEGVAGGWNLKNSVWGPENAVYHMPMASESGNNAHMTSNSMFWYHAALHDADYMLRDIYVKNDPFSTASAFAMRMADIVLNAYNASSRPTLTWSAPVSMCFRTLRIVAGMHVYGSGGWWASAAEADMFRAHLRKHTLGSEGSSSSRCDRWRALFLPSSDSFGQVLNMDEVNNVIEANNFTLVTLPRIPLDNATVERHSRLLSDVDLLIGMHRSPLHLMYFLPRHSSLIELLSYGSTRLEHMNMAYAANLNYASVHHYGLENSTIGTGLFRVQRRCSSHKRIRGTPGAHACDNYASYFDIHVDINLLDLALMEVKQRMRHQQCRSRSN